MATNTEIPNLDGEIASSDTKGKLQDKTNVEDEEKVKATSSANPDHSNGSSEESSETIEIIGATEIEEADSTESQFVSIVSSTTTVAISNTESTPSNTIVSKSVANELEEEDDEELDESLAERLWGLTEMFPSGLRSASYNTVSSSLSLTKSMYQLSRQVVWVAVSTAVILFAPVMFELERINVEEMMKQDRNRLVLGPGSAMSGTSGMMPPPPR